MKMSRQVLWNRGGFGWLEGFSERHDWSAKGCSASEGGSLYDSHTILPAIRELDERDLLLKIMEMPIRYIG